MAAYPDGVENFFAGAFPPPGFYYQNYLLYYNAPLIRGNVPPEATVYSVAEVLRFVYSSKVKVLGANWGVQVVVPLLYVGFRSKPAGISDYQFGVGNIAFDPFILAWHFGEFHITTGLDFIFPGTFDRNVVRQTRSCRRYPFGGWPGRLVLGKDGSLTFAEATRRLRLPKRGAGRAGKT